MNAEHPCPDENVVYRGCVHPYRTFHVPDLSLHARALHWEAACAGLLLLTAFGPSPANAKLPELDAIYWGQVRHNSVDPVVPSAAGQVAVVAKLDGTEISRVILAPNTNEYVLKVPLDDGLSPRLPNTARFAERIRIHVVNLGTNASYEANESESLGLLISSVKGHIQPLSLTLDQDLGIASGTNSGSLATWLAAHNANISNPANHLLNTPESLAADYDGDGLSNQDEFLSATDPTNAADGIRILETTVNTGTGIVSLKYGPARLGRRYRFSGSPDMSEGSWVAIGDPVLPRQNKVHDYFEYLRSTNPSLVFFRLSVELE